MDGAAGLRVYFDESPVHVRFMAVELNSGCSEEGPNKEKRMKKLATTLAGVAATLTMLGGVAATATPAAAQVSVGIGIGGPVGPGGGAYCWYSGGWHGPGYYWCGYAWRRGYGWGGPWGWRGWRWRDGYWGGGRWYGGPWRRDWDHDRGWHRGWDRDHHDGGWNHDRGWHRGRDHDHHDHDGGWPH